jgi:hypothetical protein
MVYRAAWKMGDDFERDNWYSFLTVQVYLACMMATSAFEFTLYSVGPVVWKWAKTVLNE